MNDEDQAEQEAAVPDKAAYDQAQKALTDAIEYTELQDRQNLIDGVKQTVSMYDAEIAKARARIDALKVRDSSPAGCAPASTAPASKS